LINVLLILSVIHSNFCEEIYTKAIKLQPSEKNIVVCELLLEDAIQENVPIDVILALAFEETRMTPQPNPNPWGCVGPLQIKVEYWCYGKSLDKCDTYHDGVKAIKYYLKKFPPLTKSICFYNDARKKKCIKSKGYKTKFVEGFLRYQRIISSVLKKDEYQTLREHSSVTL